LCCSHWSLHRLPSLKKTFKYSKNLHGWPYLSIISQTIQNEGRPLPLLWDWLIRRSTFPSVFGLEKLAEKQPPRKGKWAAEVEEFLHAYFTKLLRSLCILPI